MSRYALKGGPAAQLPCVTPAGPVVVGTTLWAPTKANTFYLTKRRTGAHVRNAVRGETACCSFRACGPSYPTYNCQGSGLMASLTHLFSSTI